MPPMDSAVESAKDRPMEFFRWHIDWIVEINRR